MKTVCIHHSVDCDGWMSAAIVKHWFNSKVEVPNKEGEPINTLDFIGYNYGQPIPDLSEYDKVIMVDISFPTNVMQELKNTKELTWIDHHISAINELGGAMMGLRNTKFAACELTWQYFFPDEPMPEIVRLLGLYDSFRHKGTDEEQKVLEFQYGARQVITNYEEAYIYLNESLMYMNNPTWNRTGEYSPEINILDKGEPIYKYLCTEAKQTYKNGFEIKFAVMTENQMNEKDFDFIKGATYFKWKKFICINKERFNPINFGIDYHKDGYDGVASFWYADNKWHFSLYNDNGQVDCSAIAKQYGGGGHFSASGFICDTKTFLKIIKNG